MNKRIIPSLAGLLLLMITPLASAEFVVIVNANSANAPTKDTIEKLFLGKRKTFTDGSDAVPINLSAKQPARKAFNKAVLGKSNRQLKGYWARLLFTGKATPPQEFASEQEIVNYVETHSNAIGYVTDSAISDGVKVVHSY